MPGILSIDELRDLHEKGSVETVICAIPDYWGRLVGKRLRTETFFNVALADEGLHGSLFLLCVDMEMDPRDGYDLADWQDGYPDFRFEPDLNTLCLIPWQHKTAMVICDACDEATGDLIEVAPRTILKRQIEKAATHDLSIKCATELEFFLYRGSLDAAWSQRYADLEPVSRYRSDYHIFQGTLLEDFARDVREGMTGAGLNIEFSKPEWGLGQQEINTRYTDALRMADRHIIFKTGVKEIAAQHDLVATFMAKPSIDEVGSSCHIHVSLWDAAGEKPLGWNGDNPLGMSQVMNKFLGGSVKATRPLAVTLAPNVNSYKRIQKDSFAPTAIAVGMDNRTCSHRVIGHGSSYRFENRIPGADFHPYIGIAGLIASGLHGIENDILSPDPLSENAYENPDLERIAYTFGDAVAAFRESAEARDMFGEAAYQHMLNFFATESEDFLCRTVTDWEHMRYFERI